MFEQAVQASDALQWSARSDAALIPALSGCRACGTTQMIAAPVLGICEDCGAERTLGSAEAPGKAQSALAA
jgi:hypothetical protein